MNWYKISQVGERKRIRVNDRIDPSEHSPIKDSDTIIVYHGMNNYADVVQALTHGISGKERASRRYSYEGDNNPYGLFVTIDFKTAKEFVSSYWPGTIIEFATKVKDLEAPVWPGGGYTVQGEMSQYFGEDKNKREEERKRVREMASQSEYPSISKSDRPELASLLLWSHEHQALFTGDLNPNMIRAIWVSERHEDGYSRRGDNWQRMDRKQFLELVKTIPQKGVPTKEIRNGRVFQPNDSWDETRFIQSLKKMYPHLGDEEMTQALKSLSKRGYQHEQDLLRYVWPKQLPGLIEFFSKLNNQEQNELV